MIASQKNNIPAAIIDWLVRGTIAIIAFLGAEIRSDVKQLTTTVPVLQEKVIKLEKENDVLRGFLAPVRLPAKKEEEITLSNLLNIH